MRINSTFTRNVYIGYYWIFAYIAIFGYFWKETHTHTYTHIHTHTHTHILALC